MTYTYSNKQQEEIFLYMIDALSYVTWLVKATYTQSAMNYTPRGGKKKNFFKAWKCPWGFPWVPCSCLQVKTKKTRRCDFNVSRVSIVVWHQATGVKLLGSLKCSVTANGESRVFLTLLSRFVVSAAARLQL